jgi:Protein of unknown function (DUF2892)
MAYPIQASTTIEEHRMKLNVGGMDRILRIVVGLVLIGLTVTGNVGAWGWLGVVPLATGAIGWCPPYAIFGWNTCSTKTKS